MFRGCLGDIFGKKKLEKKGKKNTSKVIRLLCMFNCTVPSKKSQKYYQKYIYIYVRFDKTKLAT